ncbi:MAG: SGNH/GDSL hydrolase family protein [Bacteroidia bacterium]|nr:SGNH/GDSL hydrolase family protein [Bacteroidia bacterium]
MKQAIKLLIKILWLLIPFALILFYLEFNLPKITNSYNKKHRDFTLKFKTTDYIITGNSHAIKGIDPAEISPQCYNLANVSQSLYYDAALVLKYIDQMPSLKGVIIPVSYYSLQVKLSETSEEWRGDYYQKFWGTSENKKISWIKTHSYVSLYTPTLSIKYAFKGFNTDLVPEIDANGFQHTDTVNYNYSKTSGAERIAFHHSIMKEENIKINTEYLDSLLKILAARNIKAYLITIPVHPYYREGENANIINQNETILNTLANKYKAVFIHDLTETGNFQDADFLDNDHLNTRGARKLSKLIKTYLP